MCGGSKAIKRFELIELPVALGQTGRVTFPSVPQLRNQANQIILIRNIFVFTVADYAASQYNNAVPVIPNVDLPKAVLVLYVNGEESIHLVPLTFMVVTDDAARPYVNFEFPFADISNVDFDKSYVQFSSGASAACVIPFGVNYVRLSKDPSGNFVEG